MELSREVILGKTNYGLNIYAHVLRQYYAGETVLSLRGRDCQPAANPFNNNRPTLQISIVNNGAIHRDEETDECKGDAFDFAAAHYGVTGEALYKKLNEEMHLNIGKASYPVERKEEREQPIEKPPLKIALPVFSYYRAPVKNVVPCRLVNLVEVYRIIRSQKLAPQTAALRLIADKKQAREYKAAHFDYVTFSGVFSKRSDKHLQKHSGLLTIDIDHIGSPAGWIDRLLKDAYFETELLFVSPSGDGLKWIIPIDLTQATHLDYFKSISNYMLCTYGLQIDSSGSECSRACFLPHDPGCYINSKYLK
jgi:hypothetical protein